MSRVVAARRDGFSIRRIAGIGACAVLLFFAAFPRSGHAREPFEGYSQEVREQAGRVVAAAGPGRGKQLDGEIALLRKKMLARGILSMNEIPDAIYARAVKERWVGKAGESIRAATPVSALSVPMWAWLVKDDLRRVDIGSIVGDARNLFATVRWFAPALMGYAAWVVSFLSAAACWFVAWAAILLYLRALPSLEDDLQRVVRIPQAEYAAPVVAFLLFIVPPAAGAGLAVTACLWLLLSAAYCRRAEISLLFASFLLLGGLIVAGGAMGSMAEVTGDVGATRWLAGEGFATAAPRAAAAGQGEIAEVADPWMVRFAAGRLATQAGRPEEAEKIWTELLAGGKASAEVYNNRGIALAQQGKARAALGDFQAAIEKRPDDGPALWNAYQVYLQSFSLELASAVQPKAWDAVGRMAPFSFRPAEMDQGEWIASTLPVDEILGGYVEKRREAVDDLRGSDIFELFFHPFGMTGAFWLLGFGIAAAAVVKLATLKLWVSCTCRACGGHFLVTGNKEVADLCTPCRGQVGEGVRSGEERERRLRTIRLHSRYVKVCSVLAPGSGGLWAGKEIRTALYGAALSLALAGVTLSLGGIRGGGGLVTALQDLLLWLTGGLSVLFWAGGALWSVWSFNMLQERSNLPLTKR